MASCPTPVERQEFLTVRMEPPFIRGSRPRPTVGIVSCMDDDQDQPPKERRRGGRLPLQLPVQAEAAGESWPTRTEDLSAGGCRLTAPGPLAPGAPVRLVLGSGSARPPLRISGVVTWTSHRAPWSHGVAFSTSSLEGAARWLTGLLVRRALPRLDAASGPAGSPTPTPVPLPLMHYPLPYPERPEPGLERNGEPGPAEPTPGPRPVARLALVARRAPGRVSD